jgi:cell division protein ZapA (FtsZ GTPase activity inhibitor)
MEFNILGQKITIKDPKEAEMASIALKVVNEKVAEIQEAKPLLGPQSVAVLALLEVAGSLVRDRHLIDEYREALDQKCSSLMNEISKVSPLEKRLEA